MEDIYKTIVLESENGISTITLNQPERLNLMTDEMFGELLHAFSEIEKDESVRVVILTAAGKIFCGGVDLREHFLAPIEKNKKAEINMALEDSFSRVGIAAILNLKKPLIAAINGSAVGLGFTMCLPFDIRIASQNAKIILPFLRIGIAPEFGSTYFLPRLVGTSKALELIYSGETLNAERAKEIGLVNKVVPFDNLMEETLELARRIVDAPPIALRLTRATIYQGAHSDLETAVRTEHFAYNVCRQTEDHEEAVKSFLEKRTPVFKGK